MSDHPSEEDLVLHHYAESGPGVAAHLSACAECATRLEALRRDLRAVPGEVPERGEDYGAQVWARLEPRLGAPPRVLVFRPRRFVMPAALAASLLIAFLLGRHTQPPQPSPRPTVSAAARERVLMGAVSDHLERSRRVLVEMTGAAAGPGPVDIAAEQATAANLVANSRLYRQSAERAGEARVADLLDELERVLVEIANAPADMRPEDLRDLRQRIESRDLLFKVRALQSQVQERTAKRERPRTIS
jgi:hypothetical protein